MKCFFASNLCQTILGLHQIKFSSIFLKHQCKLNSANLFAGLSCIVLRCSFVAGASRPAYRELRAKIKFKRCSADTQSDHHMSLTSREHLHSVSIHSWNNISEFYGLNNFFQSCLAHSGAPGLRSALCDTEVTARLVSDAQTRPQYVKVSCQTECKRS